MNSYLSGAGSSIPALIACLLISGLNSLPSRAAEDAFAVGALDRLSNGDIRIRHASAVGTTWILDHAATVDGGWSPVQTHAGAAVSGEFLIPAGAQDSQGFYRLRRYADPAAFGRNVSAGTAHTAAVRADGTLWAWGDNSAGQLGDGTYVSRMVPTRIGTDSNWCAVAAGTSHTLGLRSDGTLWTWGDAGLLVNCCSLVPVQVGTDTNWVAVATSRDTYNLGFSTSFGLKRDGSLWGWGDGSQGQLGGHVRANVSEPIRVDDRNDWAAVFPAPRHTLGLRKDGTLWAWGFVNGQDTPVQVGTDTDWVEAAAGEDPSDHVSGNPIFSLALKSDGSLYSWGGNAYGQLGNGGFDSVAEPVRLSHPRSWSHIVAGSTHCVALSIVDGSAWIWGGGDAGQIGDARFTPAPSPVAVGVTGAIAATAGAFHTALVLADGSLVTWGSDAQGQLGNATSFELPNPVRVGASTNWVSVSAGYAFNTGVVLERGALGWGLNDAGQLGLGDEVARAIPSPVAAGTASFLPATVVSGRDHALAVGRDGLLWAWGDGAFGKLGVPDLRGTNVPVQVGAETNWLSAAAGQNHSLALKTDGTLWAWGQNYRGRLGLDGVAVTNVPTQVGDATNWTSVSTALSHSVALRADGTLWAWGANDLGQLGIGEARGSAVPVQVGSDTDWAAVSAGRNFTVAIRNDGTLWAWGDNSESQLGIPAIPGTNAPALVNPFPDWVRISAGGAHCLAVRGTGAVWGWGRNAEHQVDGSNNKVPLPRQIGLSFNWTSVSAGEAHSLAIQKDGSLWFWGTDSAGEGGQLRSYGPGPVSGGGLWTEACGR